jgi:hypothetical protein
MPVSNNVAVVIPCYNLGRFVVETVDSVLAQSRPAAEIVIVDDGSTDLLTLQRFEELRARNLTVLRTSNRGLSAARNFGVSRTSSPYVVTLDADDILDPRYLAATADVLDRHPEIGFVSTGIDAFGDASYQWTPPPCSITTALTRGAAHPASMFRRTMWQAVGGFDESSTFREGCEDLDFWISLMAAGTQGFVVPEPLLRYRVRRASLHHGKVATGDYVRLMQNVLVKHQSLVNGVGPALLVEKDRFIEEQRVHKRHQEGRAAALREELMTLDAEIGDRTAALGRLNQPTIDWGDLDAAAPLGLATGADRGTPVDERWFASFLREHVADLRGDVATLGATAAAAMQQMRQACDAAGTEFVDVGDLRSLGEVQFDCLVVTSFDGAFDRIVDGLHTMQRMLRPGGTLFCMLPAAIGLTNGASPGRRSGHGFTEAAVRRLFAKLFPADAFAVRTYGNVLANLAVIYGLAAEDIPADARDSIDPWHPLLHCVRAVNS